MKLRLSPPFHLRVSHVKGLGCAAGIIDESTLKQIDRKLKLCRNPIYDPSSEQYKKQQAEKQKRKLEAKKAAAAAGNHLKRASAAMTDAQALGLGEDLFLSPKGGDQQQDSKRRKSKESHSPQQQPVGMS